jgi:hypothetical protein
MSGLDKEFNEYWDSNEGLDDNPYELESALFWAWEGWQAGVKREREACAKVCDERAAAHPMGSDEQCEAEDCAAAIRARGQQENG